MDDIRWLDVERAADVGLRHPSAFTPYDGSLFLRVLQVRIDGAWVDVPVIMERPAAPRTHANPSPCTPVHQQG